MTQPLPPGLYGPQAPSPLAQAYNQTQGPMPGQGPAGVAQLGPPGSPPPFPPPGTVNVGGAGQGPLGPQATLGPQAVSQGQAPSAWGRIFNALGAAGAGLRDAGKGYAGAGAAAGMANMVQAGAGGTQFDPTKLTPQQLEMVRQHLQTLPQQPGPGSPVQRPPQPPAVGVQAGMAVLDPRSQGPVPQMPQPQPQPQPDPTRFAPAAMAQPVPQMPQPQPQPDPTRMGGG